MGRQFAGDVEENALLSVRSELHLNDLYAGTGADRLRGSIPKQATAAAEVWRTTTVDLGSTIQALRRVTKQKDRQIVMASLRERSLDRGDRGGW